MPHYQPQNNKILNSSIENH